MSMLPTTFKKDEVLVLLGAGASVDAGIPHSAMMIQAIEEALAHEWREYSDLYNFVRSAIFYADGLHGTFGNDVLYNIERLVVSLDELARREEHPIYPFVGAWNPRLTQVAGPEFRRVTEFKTKILEKLRHEWIEIDNYAKADYFRGLVRFQKELNFPLHVFTLNYDLCEEKAYQTEYGEFPQRGFGKDRYWSHALLDESIPEQSPIYLYKLHGSIDWLRDAANRKLTFSDSTSKIKVDEGELIFGTTYKLQSVDPFLYLVYQFRRRSLESRLMIVVGYGFGDEHINGILNQALRGDPEKRLVSVTWSDAPKSSDERSQREREFRTFVTHQLAVDVSRQKQVSVILDNGKEFISERLTLQAMANIFPREEALFPDLQADAFIPGGEGTGTVDVATDR